MVKPALKAEVVRQNAVGGGYQQFPAAWIVVARPVRLTALGVGWLRLFSGHVSPPVGSGCPGCPHQGWLRLAWIC